MKEKLSQIIFGVSLALLAPKIYLKLYETLNNGKNLPQENSSELLEALNPIINFIIPFLGVFAMVIAGVFYVSEKNVSYSNEDYGSVIQNKEESTMKEKALSKVEELDMKVQEFEDKIMELQVDIIKLADMKSKKKGEIANLKGKAKKMLKQNKKEKAENLLKSDEYSYAKNKIEDYEEKIANKHQILAQYQKTYQNLEFKVKKLKDRKLEEEIEHNSEEVMAEINNLLENFAV